MNENHSILIINLIYQQSSTCKKREGEKEEFDELGYYRSFLAIQKKKEIINRILLCLSRHTSPAL